MTQPKQPYRTQEDKKGPAVKFPPPLIFLIFILTGYLFHRFIPIGLGIPTWGNLIGSVLISVAMLVLLFLLVGYLRAKTSIEPWKPTSHIITTGLYAHSRNPIYATFCLINIGVGCYLNSLWVLISFLPSAFLVYHIAIRREEAYLEAKFGKEYLRYKHKVRRWL